jgi:hypothetical protein
MLDWCCVQDHNILHVGGGVLLIVDALKKGRIRRVNVGIDVV